MQADLAELRATRDQSRPISVQIRGLEGKVKDKQRQIEAAKLAATVAAESVREAQKNLEATDAKVVDIATKLAEVERELRDLCSRPMEKPPATKPNDIVGNGSIFGELDPQLVASATSPEEQEALQRAETIMARVRQQKASEAASVHDQFAPTQLDAPATAATTAAPTAVAAASAA